ncbi:MAG: hypothetical protein HUJ68_12400 [Clostridia bacterium]|nr:hypothetical protein [Clostridia bacterium]
MPNWMRCRMQVKYTDFDAFVKTYIQKDRIGNPQFDFNQIDRMPKELEMEKGTKQQDALRLAATERCPYVFHYGSKEQKLSVQEFRKFMILMYGKDCIELINTIVLSEQELAKILAKYAQNEIEELRKIANKCEENMKNYGYKDWYDWAIAHWGTKWNTVDTIIDMEKQTIEWRSPWTYPIEVLTTLSSQYPSYELTLEYAEERPGYISGKIILKNGKIVLDDQYIPYSLEAHSMDNKLWNKYDA